MPPRKNVEDNRKRANISIEMKHKIIEMKKQGVSVADLARQFNRSKSTICTVLKNMDKLKDIDASMGVTRISSQRPRVLDDVERFLLIWINEKQMLGDNITKNIICKKARAIFAELVEKTPGTTTAGEEVFRASAGWFENFKKRTGIHSVVGHAESFVGAFKMLVDKEDFKCGETGLLSKKMAKRTYITEHKPMKDSLDGDELVKEHNQELNIEDFLEVHCTILPENVQETLSVVEVAEEEPSSGSISEMLKAWKTVSSFVEKHHPNKTVAKHATDLFNDKAVSHFQQILKHRQNKTNTRQLSLKGDLDCHISR